MAQISVMVEEAMKPAAVCSCQTLVQHFPRSQGVAPTRTWAFSSKPPLNSCPRRSWLSEQSPYRHLLHIGQPPCRGTSVFPGTILAFLQIANPLLCKAFYVFLKRKERKTIPSQDTAVLKLVKCSSVSHSSCLTFRISFPTHDGGRRHRTCSQERNLQSEKTPWVFKFQTSKRIGGCAQNVGRWSVLASESVLTLQKWSSIWTGSQQNIPFSQEINTASLWCARLYSRLMAETRIRRWSAQWQF
jgi:hypothetical protein